MKERKSILGRGLNELFDAQDRLSNLTLAERTDLVPISKISPNPTQPRHYFDDDKIELLAQSIKESGLLQPIVVRPLQKTPGLYEIVAGERRWRASRLAGLQEVSVVVKDVSDKESLKLALLENIQREDLNILEEAEGYQRLIEEYGYTQEKIAQEVGKSRSHIANTLRLLTLPNEVKDFLVAGQLTPGHARALVNDENALESAREILQKNLKVRDVEKRKKGDSAESEDLALLKSRLASLMSQPVTLTPHKKGIQVQINFKDLWELEDFIHRVSSNSRSV